MSRRLTGNHGVSALGLKKEKKEKAKRTPINGFVLGSLVSSYLDDLARQRGGCTRSEMLRALIVAAHKEHIGGGVYGE